MLRAPSGWSERSKSELCSFWHRRRVNNYLKINCTGIMAQSYSACYPPAFLSTKQARAGTWKGRTTTRLYSRPASTSMGWRYERTCCRNTYWNVYHKLLCPSHLSFFTKSYTLSFETVSYPRTMAQAGKNNELRRLKGQAPCDGITDSELYTRFAKNSESTKIKTIRVCRVQRERHSSYIIETASAGKRSDSSRTRRRKYFTASIFLMS